MPKHGALTLADVHEPHLFLVCKLCNRRGQYRVASLLAKHGDAVLADLRGLLSADCPKRASFSVHYRCQALFEFPNGPPSSPER
jgi:hypothetical protein